MLNTNIKHYIKQGVFAVAEAKHEDKYLSITLGQDYFGMISPSTLLVKKEIAKDQLHAEEGSNTDGVNDIYTPSTENKTENNGIHEGNDTTTGQGGNTENNNVPPRPHSPQHFAMDVALDKTRINKQVNDYVTEILQHLMNVKGANVNIRLDIDVDLPEGTPENVVRTVSENCQTLKIQNFHFE